MNMKKMGYLGRKICRGIWKGVKEHKEEIFTLSLMAVSLVLVQDTCSATQIGQSTTFANDVKITAIKQPLEVLETTLTGPIPKAVGTLGIITGAVGWGIGTEQQIVKYATRVAGGTGIAVGGGSVMYDFFGVGQGVLF